MAKIPVIDAGVIGLRPSEAGEAAWREAGVITTRLAGQAAEQVREEGADIGRSVSEFGQMIDKVGQQAQDHTDMTAWLDAQKDATANDLGALDAIQGVGTGRKDANGDFAPSTAAFNQGTGDVMSQYEQSQEGEHEKFVASGASQKAQDDFTKQQAARYRQIAMKAHSEAITVAGQEALGNVSKATNTMMATVDRHPELLDDQLGQYGDTISKITAGMGKLDAQQNVGPKAEAGKAGLVSAAIFSYARNGQFDQAARIMNDPKYDELIGKHRETIMNTVNGIQSSGIRQQNAQDAHDAKMLKAAQDRDIDAVTQNLRLPPNQQDPKLTQQSLFTNPNFAGHPEDRDKALKTINSAFANDINPDQSQRISRDLEQQMTMGKITLPGQIDAAIFDKDGHRLISSADEKALKQSLTDLNASGPLKQFYSGMKEWEGKNASLIDRGMVDTQGMIQPGIKSELGQMMLSRWDDEVKRQGRIMLQKGEDPSQLLNPAYKGNMVSPEAMAPYRVTQQMRLDYAAQQGRVDVSKTRPVQITPDVTPEQVLKDPKTYPPGSYIQLPNGGRYIVPGTAPQKSNFQTEEPTRTNPASAAIDNALATTVDAHLDKNLFSSGRAKELGIQGGVGKNLTSIEAQGHSIQVNASAAPHFKGFLDELTRMGYKVDSLGGLAVRPKRDGNIFASYSEHAYGNAIDINPGVNKQHSSANNFPPNIAVIAARYGLVWGGEWRGKTADPMHFEWSGKSQNVQTAGQ